MAVLGRFLSSRIFTNLPRYRFQTLLCAVLSPTLRIGLILAPGFFYGLGLFHTIMGEYEYSSFHQCDFFSEPDALHWQLVHTCGSVLGLRGTVFSFPQAIS